MNKRITRSDAIHAVFEEFIAEQQSLAESAARNHQPDRETAYCHSIVVLRRLLRQVRTLTLPDPVAQERPLLSVAQIARATLSPRWITRAAAQHITEAA